MKPQRETVADFTVGLHSFPYLADHGFQDMVVLPGAFYVEMALRVARERFGCIPRVFRNVNFLQPIILSAHDTSIRVDVTDSTDATVTFTFYEAAPGDHGAPARHQDAATLDIDWTSPIGRPVCGLPFSIDEFQALASSPIAAGDFYAVLRENGNQYGPRFQRISSIWHAGDHSLGMLSVPGRDPDTEPDFVHPSLLDSMTQLMAPMVMEKGKTFILRSIDSIEMTDLDLPATLWGHATLLHDPALPSRAGNVQVFDESGRICLELFGVSFSTLDDLNASSDSGPMNLVVTSNFTAEPVEDSLKFWGDHFGVPIHVEFAPYNQIFQQLLDSGSALRRNRDGVNVILVGLEEWANGQQPVATTLDRETAARCFGQRSRCTLPNGLEIAHLNQYETDYLYKEIFEDQCYLRHGIRLQDGDVVLDIGANIGLFSLFVLSHCPNAQVYAFEPAPAVYDLLNANCNAYGQNVRALNLGVSDKPGTSTFTFYEKSSVFSSFRADEAEDRTAIQAVVRNALSSDPSLDRESLGAYVDELTADRVRRSSHECRMTSVSAIIREHQLQRVDLLKIDAERSELDIIAGIEDDDWPKISQVVIEIHDRSRKAVQNIEDLLIRKGFRCAVQQETLLENSGLFNLYATRDEAEQRSSALSTGQLQRNLDDFGAALRSLTSQATAPLLLCVCPRSPAAEADGELKSVLDGAEQALLSLARTLPNVFTIDSASLQRAYPLLDYYDRHGHQLGHVPYTSDCYHAIGTAVIRTIFALNSRPFKVIALDCDNTLWKGVCAEDGPQGIDVTPHHRALQQFMLDSMNAGMLLCLCSKNNEKDVLDVFDQRDDMILRREHFVSWRINWNSKAANIRSLAEELNLGLDSFIFIDDNPVDCADVRSGCSGVLTLQLPGAAQSFPTFLHHIWAFDRLKTTDEDRGRTRLYREQSERQELQKLSLSLQDFINGLQLRVETRDATRHQLGRVSQLTSRTNQFNLTTIRRTEDEIRRFMERQDAACLAIRVADRFGDYGVVGVVMYESAEDRYRVDTFLLSCRVLGRGVEHAVVSELAQRAKLDGKPLIEFAYLPTARNVPALEFLTSIGSEYQCEASSSWVVPVDRLLRLTYDPDAAPVGGEVTPALDTAQGAMRARYGFEVLGHSDRLQRIGEEFSDIGRLSKAIEQHRMRQQPPEAVPDIAPGTALENALATIWSKVLARPRIGLNDNFFEAGGTSLRAVQVIALIKRELKQTLSIVSLFESPTVALLAARLRGIPEGQGNETRAGAAQRGQQRRYRSMNRKAS